MDSDENNPKHIVGLMSMSVCNLVLDCSRGLFGLDGGMPFQLIPDFLNSFDANTDSLSSSLLDCADMCSYSLQVLLYNKAKCQQDIEE